MISPACVNFTIHWLRKAEQYGIRSISGCYDRYFTLFVAYNRLYSENTFELVRQRRIEPLRGTFPDRVAATDNVVLKLGAEQILTSFQDDPRCVAAIQEVLGLLEGSTFCICLDRVTGDPVKRNDAKFAEKIRNGSDEEKAITLLNVLYRIRCNLVHGNKEFAEIQLQVLVPALVLLEKLTNLLLARLQRT